MIVLLATVALAGTHAPDPTCEGDPTCDAGPALATAIAATAADGEGAVLDLRGTWYVGAPVHLHCSGCTVLAGSLHVAPDADLPHVVALDMPGGSEIHGILRVRGRRTSWHRHRTATDGIHLTSVGGLRADGLDVRDVRRWGIRIPRGSHAIGADLGMVRVHMAGTPGGVGTAPHTRAEVTATQIERHGGGRSLAQRATVTVDEVPPDLHVGDRAWVGLHLVEVMEIEDHALTVYPWPGALEGVGDWPVDPVIGGGISITGGNTTGLTIDNLDAGYVGVGIEVAALYGAHVRAPVVEVVGVGVVIGGRTAATWGLSLHGLHPEITGLDVLQAGLNVARCTVISPVVDLTSARYQVASPTLSDGTPWPSPMFRVDCRQIPDLGVPP